MRYWLTIVCLFSFAATASAEEKTFDEWLRSAVVEEGISCESVADVDPLGVAEDVGGFYAVGCSGGGYHVVLWPTEGDPHHVADLRSVVLDAGESCDSIDEVLDVSIDGDDSEITVACSSGENHVVLLESDSSVTYWGSP